MKRFIAIAAVSFSAASASADEVSKEACADAYDTSQVLRDSGRLVPAREQLRICERSCPAPLAADCTGWRGAIEAKLGSLSFRAVDGEGRPVNGVTVSIDGSSPEPLLPGDVLVAPGAHEVRFASQGREVVQRIELAEGERNRLVTATFADEATDEAGMSGQAIAAIVLASSGGAALIAGGALTIKGHVDRDALFDCKPNCAQQEVDAVASTWAVAGIVAGIGGAALGVAAILWAMDGDAPLEAAGSGVRWRF